MKNIERGSIKHLVILIILISVFGMIIFPVLDFIIDKFITNSEFVYSFRSYIIQPTISGVTIGLLLWLIDKKNK